MKKLTRKQIDKLNNLKPLNKLLKIIQILRDPINGCPWDIEQTFESLSNYPIEEAYELQNAIYKKDLPNIKEELGDLLLQVVLFSQIGEDEKKFSFNDVCNIISKKIIRRHPQIFDLEYKLNNTPEETWEKIKEKEKVKKKYSFESIFEEIPSNLPPLLKSYKIQKKVSSLNFDWNNHDDVLIKIEEELKELKIALKNINNIEHIEEEIGDLLFTVVNLIRHLKLNPDKVMEKATIKFIKRFLIIEKLIYQKNIKIDSKNINDLWLMAKNKEHKL